MFIKIENCISNLLIEKYARWFYKIYNINIIKWIKDTIIKVNIEIPRPILLLDQEATINILERILEIDRKEDIQDHLVLLLINQKESRES